MASDTSFTSENVIPKLSSIPDFHGLAYRLTEEGKASALSVIHGLAEDTSRWADMLNETPTLQTYAQSLAESFHDVAEGLSNEDLDTVLDSLHTSFQERPLLSFAGCMALGMVAIQLIKSSAQSR